MGRQSRRQRRLSLGAGPPVARRATPAQRAGLGGSPRQAHGSRRVNAAGKISRAGFSCHAGAACAGEPAEVVVAGGLGDIRHAGAVAATHAPRLRADQAGRAPRARVTRRARDATAGLTVTRLANNTGVITFAGKTYAAGRRRAHTSTGVTIAAGSVPLSNDGTVIRAHPIRHDRAKEPGAFANPKGPPPPQELRHRQRRLTIMSPRHRNCFVAQVPGLDTGRAASVAAYLQVRTQVSMSGPGSATMHRVPRRCSSAGRAAVL